MAQVSRLLILTGVLLVSLGLLLKFGQRVGLGRIPGDLTWRGRNVTVHLPLATSLLLSVLATLAASLLLRSRR
jgi:hypothetical protein